MGRVGVLVLEVLGGLEGLDVGSEHLSDHITYSKQKSPFTKN